MSTTTEVKVEWNGKAVMQDFDKAQFKSLFQSANLVEGQAVASVTVDTGHLKQSITKQVNKDNAVIGTNVDYAPHIEFGTRRMKAQPFLLPSLIKNVKKIIEVFRKNGINLKWVTK